MHHGLSSSDLSLTVRTCLHLLAGLSGWSQLTTTRLLLESSWKTLREKNVKINLTVDIHGKCAHQTVNFITPHEQLWLSLCLVSPACVNFKVVQDSTDTTSSPYFIPHLLGVLGNYCLKCVRLLVGMICASTEWCSSWGICLHFSSRESITGLTLYNLLKLSPVGG